jgi:hypothetical protein
MKLGTKGFLAAGLMAIAPMVSATVLTFDDLTGQAAMPANYMGFDFSAWTHYDFDQPPYTPASPPTRLYTFDANAPVSSAADFTFDGAFFSGEQDATVTFELYDNGVLVHTSSTLAPTVVPAFLSSGYGGLIDEVVVVSPRPDFYVMDNFTFNGSVPEPATLALLGIAVVGLGFSRRRPR